MGYNYSQFRNYRKKLQEDDEKNIVGNYRLCRDKGLTIMQVQDFLQRGYCFKEILAGRWYRGKYQIEDLYKLSEWAKLEEAERLGLE